MSPLCGWSIFTYDLQLRTTWRLLLSLLVHSSMAKRSFRLLRLYPLAFQRSAIPRHPPSWPRFDPANSAITPPSCRLPPRRSCGHYHHQTEVCATFFPRSFSTSIKPQKPYLLGPAVWCSAEVMDVLKESSILSRFTALFCSVTSLNACPENT